MRGMELFLGRIGTVRVCSADAAGRANSLTTKTDLGKHNLSFYSQEPLGPLCGRKTAFLVALIPTRRRAPDPGDFLFILTPHFRDAQRRNGSSWSDQPPGNDWAAMSGAAPHRPTSSASRAIIGWLTSAFLPRPRYVIGHRVFPARITSFWDLRSGPDQQTKGRMSRRLPPPAFFYSRQTWTAFDPT
jgi:hypothetical protein